MDKEALRKAVQTTETDLAAIIQKYEKFGRKDPDPPSKNRFHYFRDGTIGVLKHIACYSDYGTTEEPMILGIKIGSKFAEPVWYKYPEGVNWIEAEEERKEIVSKLEKEVLEILEPLKPSFGGWIKKYVGSAYTQLGYANPEYWK